MRSFDEFIEIGFIKKRTKDEARARNLIDGAEKRRIVMDKYLPLNKETTVQIIEECYDIIRELLEAKLSKEGYKSYNHEAVISYLTKLGFSRDVVDFADKLRENRHGTKYYGKSVSEEYAKMVKEFLDKIYPKLRKIALE